MRQLEGKTLAVPINDTAPDSTVHGAKLIQIADTTASWSHVRPRLCGLFVPLTGGASVELIVYVRSSTAADGDIGWARLADTGNLGKLGGMALPSDETYMFLVQFGMIFDEILLVAVNNIGGVDTSAGAKLIEYAEYIVNK